MITHSDSFVGALGKIRASGGSRAFTTPTTVDVPPEYSIGVDVQGELIANSLDGRLWIFRNDAGLGVVVLNWNASTGRLELSDVQAFAGSSDTVLARGIDWVLTNSRIFMASGSSPYVLCSDIFADDCPSSFLYSLLRKGSVSGSGTDPFTGEAWGKRNDNGNSGGEGYFLRDSHLLYPAGTHTFEQCYSVLPAVGEWQLFENFLVRRPDAPLSESYNGQLNVRPLIPLELKGTTPAFGTGYNFDHRGIQLSCVNGVLWARGLYHIGRAYILPAVFDADGNPVEFYLYISPEYPCSPFLADSAQELSEQGYMFFQGHMFKLFDTPMTPRKAKAACEDMGGHLATSTSEAKNDFLANLYNGWIILGAFKSAGQWQWVTGESWDFVNWRIFAPSNRADETCLASYFGGWNDDTDTFSAPYVCEWDYDLSQGGVISEGQWLNLAPAVVGEDLCAFVSQLQGAVRSGTCSCALETQLFSPEGGLWLDLTENNGRLFVDIARSAGLLLNDNGAQVLGSDFVDCKALPQWIAPAGDVAAVAGGMILAAAGNSLFATCTERGFMREVLGSRCLPLSFGYSDFQAAVGLAEQDDSRAAFLVNNLSGGAAKTQPIAWSSVYKQCFSVSPLRSFPASEMPQKEGPQAMPLFVRKLSENISLRNKNFYLSRDNIRSGSLYDSLTWLDCSFSDNPDEEDDSVFSTLAEAENYMTTTAYWSEYGAEAHLTEDTVVNGVNLDAGIYEAGEVVYQILTIDFDTGEFVQLGQINAPIMAIVEERSDTHGLEQNLTWLEEHWNFYPEVYPFYEEFSTTISATVTAYYGFISSYVYPSFGVRDNRICVSYRDGAVEDIYLDIPSSLDTYNSLDTSKAPAAAYDYNARALKVSEPVADVPFYVNTEAHELYSFVDIRNPFYHSKSDTYTRCLMLFRQGSSEYVYSVQVHPNILDFYSEAQRSLAQ